jgi:tetratricopeptide (TPR) repeat protein
VLVIADNASSEAQVRPLLPGYGPHKVIVTSRHTLANLGARLVDVTVLDDDAGVKLLAASLRAARPKDDRIASDTEAATRLARLCGGLPLALQISAALLKGDPTLSAAELAGELAVESERLERLRYDDGSGSAAPSVAAAFELSYRSLEPVSAQVFRLLPVDPGPNVSTAAAAHLTDLPVSKVRRVLAGLARAHLIEAAPEGEGRWRMHDLLRLYAQKLSDDHARADNREHSRDRLFDYYMNAADTADDHLQAVPALSGLGDFTARDEALSWFDTERANLVAVVKMAEDTGQDEVACRLPVALVRYFNWRRRFDDWLLTTCTSLNAARRLDDRPREGIALNNLGAVLREVRRFDDAITACKDAVAIFWDTGDRHGEANALNNLGSALHEARRFDEAVTAHLQDLAICKETGDRHGEADALNNLGLALGELRRFDEAVTAHEEAASIYRETRDLHGEGIALNNLGVAIPKVWPQVNEALGALERAAAFLRETGDRHGEGMALNNLGAALREVGWSLPYAIAVHEDATDIFRETGDLHGEGIALNNLGLALVKGQRIDEAIAAHQDAARIFKRTGDRHAQGSALKNLSVALVEGQRIDEAMVAHQDATSIFNEIGDRHAIASALNYLGVALYEARSFEKAIAAHREAARIFREIGDRHAEGSALNNLGLGLLKMRRFNKAISAFEGAIALYEKTGDRHAEYQARTNVNYARSGRQAF